MNIFCDYFLYFPICKLSRDYRIGINRLISVKQTSPGHTDEYDEMNNKVVRSQQLPFPQNYEVRKNRYFLGKINCQVSSNV